MTADDRIREVVQAYEELTGRPSGARVRFINGAWTGELYPARDRNHPKALQAEAGSLDTVIAAMGVAVLAMARADGVR
jgi:hypothetical protein